MPFASRAQQGYLHAHPEKLGKAKLAEFDRATKGKKLPYRAKKKVAVNRGSLKALGAK
jgi:hypothetical protein